MSKKVEIKYIANEDEAILGYNAQFGAWELTVDTGTDLGVQKTIIDTDIAMAVVIAIATARKIGYAEGKKDAIARTNTIGDISKNGHKFGLEDYRTWHITNGQSY